ncbi:MAG: ABC transporter permease [Acidimicrobiia bacterium]
MKEASSILDRLRAVASRDLQTQTSYQFNLLLRFGSLLLAMASFFFVSQLVDEAPELASYRGSYFEFVMVGMMVTSFTLVGLRTFAQTITTEQSLGTLEILLASPMRVGNLLAGALVVPLAMTAAEILFYLILGIGFVGVGFSLVGALLALPLLILTIGTFCGLGILSAGFIVLTKRGDPITVVVTQGTTFLGGAYFPVTLMPEPVQWLARLTPAFYGIQGIREALLGGAGPAELVDEFTALIVFTAILLPGSLWLLSRALRVARITGTLGNV